MYCMNRVCLFVSSRFSQPPQCHSFVKSWCWGQYIPTLKKTSITPSCSGPLPTHRIQRHLVPGAVYSSSLHLCSFKECHIYVRPQPSTIFKVKSNNCKRIHTSALINGSCRMVSVYRSTAINFSCLKKDFRLYDR